MLGREHFVFPTADDAANLHQAVDNVIAPELEASPIEETQHAVLSPRSQRAQLADVQALRFRLQYSKQFRTQSATLFAGLHADNFQPQRRIGTAELPLQPAPEHIAGEATVLLEAELNVQQRLAQRRRQAPFEIVAPRAPGD